MSDLDELYQEVILDHNKSPRNYRVMSDANRKAEGYNPLCGDHVTVYLHLEGGVIRDVSFQGSGCAVVGPPCRVLRVAGYKHRVTANRRDVDRTRRPDDAYRS